MTMMESEVETDNGREPNQSHVVRIARRLDAALMLRRFGLDLASASAPFVATMVDVTRLVIYFTIYFTIASVIMRQVVEARP
jgi:hypothetical protein